MPSPAAHSATAPSLAETCRPLPRRAHPPRALPLLPLAPRALPPSPLPMRALPPRALPPSPIPMCVLPSYLLPRRPNAFSSLALSLRAFSHRTLSCYPLPQYPVQTSSVPPCPLPLRPEAFFYRVLSCCALSSYTFSRRTLSLGDLKFSSTAPSLAAPSPCVRSLSVSRLAEACHLSCWVLSYSLAAPSSASNSEKASSMDLSLSYLAYAPPTRVPLTLAGYKWVERFGSVPESPKFPQSQGTEDGSRSFRNLRVFFLRKLI